MINSLHISLLSFRGWLILAGLNLVAGRHLCIIASMLLVMLSPQSAFTQNFKADMQKINNCMKQGNWRMSSTIVATEQGNPVPLDKQTGESVLFGKYYYSKLGNLENIVTPTTVLYIDHEIKQIDYYSKPLATNSFFKSMEAYMDFQESLYEKKIYKDLGKGLGQYDLWAYPGNEYARITITYEKQSCRLRKVEMWYQQDNKRADVDDGNHHCDKVEITLGWKEQPKQLPEEFSINNYVSCQAKKCVAQGKLKNYEVIIRN